MLNIHTMILISVFSLSLISCEEKTKHKEITINNMNALKAKKPLIFESMFDLRNKLTEAYNGGGLEEIKKYISEEITAQRPIVLGNKTSYIFDVQLRYLDNGNLGDVIIDFKKNPTIENSQLLLTVNLVNVEPNLQLLIRKEL